MDIRSENRPQDNPAQSNRGPNNQGHLSTTEAGRSLESALQTVTQDLQRLHGQVVKQLSDDVGQLQSEKARLAAEIASLKAEQRTLATQNANALSQQQVAQQQLWAKQLAIALANHLQGVMVQQINQQVTKGGLIGNGVAAPASNTHSDNAHRLLANLDSTFSATFQSLQQELTSYQSALSQQLSRMNTLEQQGETILEALVQRLQEQTRSLHPAPPSVSPPAIAATDANALPPNSIPVPLAAPSQPSLPVVPRRAKPLSGFWLGLIMVLMSTVALSIHNVAVRVIGRPSSIWGFPEVGGFINVTVLGNSLLILWLRMLIVLPLMLLISATLYPPVWVELRKFARLWPRERRPVFVVVGSGFFLFLSQVLIYIAIGNIGAGPAVTILFMYPIATVPLSWWLFGDRPTPSRWGVMAAILLGVFLTAIPRIINTGKEVSVSGVLIAIAAGLAFALYLICMQMGFKRLHPVPVSMIQFFTTFVLSSVILALFGPNLQAGIEPDKRVGFIIGGFILGALTLVGYLANNFGVRFMGAGSASIVSSIGPALTAVLAWLLLGNDAQLQPVQWWGILIVTVAVASLSLERLYLSKRQARGDRP
jgi:drug/metabolite transporter (DMT)-like permease